MPSGGGQGRKPYRERTQPQPDSGRAGKVGASWSGTGRLKLRATAGGLGLLALLLFVHQYTTMARFGVLPPGKRAPTFSDYLAIVSEKVELGLPDYLLLAAIAGLFLALVFAEFRGGCLTALLRRVFTSEGWTIGLLAAAAFAAVRYYLGTGDFPWGGDQPQHICFAQMASRSISEGELPIWTNYLGAGTPYLQFYGFLFFYITGLVDQLWKDVFLSLKVAMGVLHAASGVAMYLLARTLTGSRRAGFIAGLAYVLSFWHTQQIIIMGRFPLSLFYALLPLPFYFFERLSSPGLAANRERLANSLAGGICLGALALTHPGYAFWATVLLGVYAGLRLSIPVHADRSRGGLVWWSGLLFAAGLVFGAYLILPMSLERDYTGLYSGMLNFAAVPVPTWQHVLAWSNYRFWVLPPPDITVNWYGGYLGLSLVLLVAGGVAAALRSRSRQLILRFLPGLCCLGLTALLVFGYLLPPLQALPVVQMLAAGRYLLFTVFFLSLAVGPAAQTLMILLRRRRWRVPVSTLILCVIAVDLGPTTFQQMYLTRDQQAMFPNLRAHADSLDAQGQLPNHRVLWTGSKHSGYWLKGMLYFESRTPSPGSFHPGKARAAADFVEPVDRYLSKLVEMGYFEVDTSGNADLYQRIPETIFGRSHWEVILTGMSMMDVRFLVVSHLDGYTQINDMSAFGSYGPVLVSPRIVPFPAGEIDQLIAAGKPFETMESEGDPGFTKVLMDSYNALFLGANTVVDPNTRACYRIFVLDAGGQELGTNPAVEVLEHTVRMQRVDLKLRVSEACFARLAYSYFPHLRVTVDGREVAPLRTAGGFMAVQLEAGEHGLVLEAELSPLRRGLLAVNLLCLAATAYLFASNRRRKRTGNPGIDSQARPEAPEGTSRISTAAASESGRPYQSWTRWPSTGNQITSTTPERTTAAT